jgi:IS5 family transposase
LQKAGVEVGKRFRDKTNSVKQQILSIAKVLQRRSQEAQDEVRQITGEILKTARRVVVGARHIVQQAETALETVEQTTQGAIRRLIGRLKQITALTDRVVKQTEEVQSGNRHIPNRVVSLCDPDARLIRKGKLKSPTEFGYKVVIQETEDRLVTGYEVCQGNPTDDAVLVPAVLRHKKVFGRAPKQVTADRGMSSASNERAIEALGVKQAALPRRGKLIADRTAHQKQRWFRSLQRWRAGIEGTISLLKRKYGMSRTRLRGHSGTRCWVAGAVWANNLTRLATMG